MGQAGFFFFFFFFLNKGGVGLPGWCGVGLLVGQVKGIQQERMGYRKWDLKTNLNGLETRSMVWWCRDKLRALGEVAAMWSDASEGTGDTASRRRW